MKVILWKLLSEGLIIYFLLRNNKKHYAKTLNLQYTVLQKACFPFRQLAEAILKHKQNLLIVLWEIYVYSSNNLGKQA